MIITAGSRAGRRRAVTPGAAGKAVLRARSPGEGGAQAEGSNVQIDDNGRLLVPEVSAPTTPVAGILALYAKADKKVYTKDSTGTEKSIGGDVSVLRNRILNGGMQISQENGTSAGTTGGYFPVDEFSYSASHDGTISVAQVASATPGGSTHRIRATVWLHA
jgi:hypothetical protein